MLCVLALSLCLSTGCSKSDSGNTKGTGDMDDIEISQNTRLDTTIEDLDGNTFVRIEADVIGGDTEEFPVVTLKKSSFTEADIKTYADNFFDNGKYHNRRYIDEYTSSDLDDIIDRYNNYKQDFINNKPLLISDEEYNEVISNADKVIEYYTNHKLTASDSVPLRCDTTYAPYDIQNDPICYTDGFGSKFGSNDNISEGYNYCILEGLHKGISYTLTFIQDEVIDVYCMEVKINDTDAKVWGDLTYNQIEGNSMDRQYDSSQAMAGKNQCKYTAEEAEAICQDIINVFNIEDMTPMSIIDVDIKGYDNPCILEYSTSRGVCGYDIAYGKTVNDKITNYDMSHVKYGLGNLISVGDDDTPIICEAAFETLVCRVMDSGIVSVEYGYPTVIEEVSTKNTPLLSFDEIEKIFEGEMIELYGGTSRSTIDNIVISKIQLGLCRITTQSLITDYTSVPKEYTLVPAWDFYIDDYQSLVTINAIDGSIINSYTGLVEK